MTVLSSKQILQNKSSNDPNSITSLTLTHKALSDVSCFSEFKNLDKLDLGFNNLSSLEDLKDCVNLKWLSVVQNKLQSLKGIEGLTKLTVLNAGKNKLRSMDEVMLLVSLRALILNDNKIVSVCKLDQMKELNTLEAVKRVSSSVLSRNAIREIGDSLVKLKSITKLSLSNCQLQTIGSSLKSCIELKELRLGHNNIKTLPAELARNTNVQNLDLGNNLITSWSNLKVLSSLINLKNLNLQGNPIAEKDKLAKKIKKLVPNLQIFNARPIDKTMGIEKGERVDDSSVNIGDKLVVQNRGQRDHNMGNKNSKHRGDQRDDGHLDNAGDLETRKELKLRKQKRHELSPEKASVHKETSNDTEKGVKKKLKKMQENEYHDIDDGETPHVDPDVQKELKHKKKKREEILKEKASDGKGDGTIIGKESRIPKKAKQKEDSVIDDVETPFVDLFAADAPENVENSAEKGRGNRTVQDINMNDGKDTFPTKRKKTKNRDKGTDALRLLSAATEIGLGGASTWDE
ncbi:unnamed protein product [Ilex paraguariensis]|uniref:Protein phosphatase 1 regulatory subunit 7 n=1 Tax=Ilex paraguariensis TaxID=185542 RepID=A0ABC8SPG5_9AQUA